MSYNESLSPNSNYPPMSQSEWDNAPWNEKEKKDREYSITVDQCLRNENVKVLTNDYIEYDYDVDLSEVDWKQEYNEQHFTILEMLAELKKYLEADLRTIPKDATREQKQKRTRIQNMLEDCQGWELMDSFYDPQE